MISPPLCRSRWRRRASPGWGRAALRGALVLLFPLAGATLCHHAWHFVRCHPYFALREVVVRGTHHLEPGEVRRATGLVLGTSIWEVDPARVEHRLVADPWIRGVAVRRELPARVAVRVRERRPVAILLGPEPYYVDRRGVAFARLGDDDPRDLPYISGLSRAEAQGGWGRRVLRMALVRLRVATRAGWPAPISEVHLDRRAGVTLYPVSPRLPVDLGWGPWTTRLSRLRRVLAFWRGKEAEVGSATLRFPGQVILRLRRGRGGRELREG